MEKLGMIIEYFDNTLLPEMKRLLYSANSIRYKNASMNFYNDISILKHDIENIFKENNEDKTKEKFIKIKGRWQVLYREFIRVFKRYDGEIGQAENIWHKANEIQKIYT